MNEIKDLYRFLKARLTFYDLSLEMDGSHQDKREIIAKGQEVKIIMHKVQDMIIAKQQSEELKVIE